MQRSPREALVLLPALVMLGALGGCEGTMSGMPIDDGGRAVDGGMPVDAVYPPGVDAAGPDAAGEAAPDAWAPPSGELGRVPAEVVAEAVAAPLGWFGVNARGERFCSSCEGASIVLAVAAYQGDESADARLLEQIRYVLGGGRDPFANGGYMAQWERTMTGMIAIARRTPRVWSQLTAEEVRAADLVMQATLVGSAYTTADASYAGGAVPTGIDGDTNLNRGWNPNYREGMVGAILVSTLYLGGASEARAFLDGYDHDGFVAALEAAGLVHLHGVFTTAGGPSGTEIAQAIEGYTYLGHELEDLAGVFVALTEDTYSGEVACGLNDGAGIMAGDVVSGLIVEGCAGLPNLGAPGQLKELDSGDANGPRSSITYAYDGFKPNLTNHLVMLVYGALPPGPSVDAAIARVRVGATDLFYKAEHGYRSYARGQDRGVFQLPPDGRADGYQFYRPLWEDVVAPVYE